MPIAIVFEARDDSETDIARLETRVSCHLERNVRGRGSIFLTDTREQNRFDSNVMLAVAPDDLRF